MKTFLYYGVILSFVTGAIIESRLIEVYGKYAILLSTALLIAALIIMFHKSTEEMETHTV